MLDGVSVDAVLKLAERFHQRGGLLDPLNLVQQQCSDNALRVLDGVSVDARLELVERFHQRGRTPGLPRLRTPPLLTSWLQFWRRLHSRLRLRLQR